MKPSVPSAWGVRQAVTWMKPALWQRWTKLKTNSSNPRPKEAHAMRLQSTKPSGLAILSSPMLTLLLALVCITGSAVAQVPPTAFELSRYQGLHAAAARGDLAQLQNLLQSKPDLTATDTHGRTALHVAAFYKQREVIRALALAGADLNRLENDRYDAVTIAAVADDEETLRVLLDVGASAKLVTSRYDGTALIAAAHLGHDGVVRQLIAAGAPVDHVNNLHWTAAIEAVILGDGGPRHQRSLQALIQAGAKLTLTDRHGHTPLALARARGFTAMVRMLEQVP
jgi:ankyrin repeat protein